MMFVIAYASLWFYLIPLYSYLWKKSSNFDDLFVLSAVSNSLSPILLILYHQITLVHFLHLICHLFLCDSAQPSSSSISHLHSVHSAIFFPYDTHHTFSTSDTYHHFNKLFQYLFELQLVSTFALIEVISIFAITSWLKTNRVNQHFNHSNSYGNMQMAFWLAEL